jgi:3-oxoacyl-[acyl-carrier protein] reductase
MLGGKVALVTGSSRGVGKAVALELARQGADVAVHCRQSLHEADLVSRLISQMGRKSMVVAGDTRKQEDVERFVDLVVRNLGDPDILVNNAAYALQKSFLATSPDEWRAQVDCKAFGYYMVSRMVLPGMLKKGRGTIINMLSTVAMRGGEGESAYAAANGAAAALTRALATELGHRGIRCCGMLLTWAENAFDSADPDCTRWLERFPLGRVTKLDEIAKTAAYLASEGAGAITGSFVTVDAGYMAR